MEFIWNLGIWLTIYYFTPCHYFISECISEYAYYMVSAVDSKEEFHSTVNIIIISISYFINFICALIFNEMIILNFCGLGYNTKKKIEERIKAESQKNENSLALYDIKEEEGEDKENSSERRSSINDGYY